MKQQEVLTEIQKRLPENFDALDDPKLMLHFVVKAASEFFQKECGLEGDWILMNGNMTMLEMMSETREQKTKLTS